MDGTINGYPPVFDRQKPALILIFVPGRTVRCGRAVFGEGPPCLVYSGFTQRTAIA